MADYRESEILIPHEKGTPLFSPGFFSSVATSPRQGFDKDVKDAATTPRWAFVALAGSTISVFASLGLLLAMNQREVWPTTGIYGIVQPAGCISLFLSLNAICSGYALTEGVGVAWWRQAMKSDATLSTVQNVWLAGSSPTQAIKMLRLWTWVSIAVLAVGVLPLNGVILQSALTTMPHIETELTEIKVPMAQTLDIGFSTNGNPNYTPASDSVLRTAFPSIWQQVINPAGLNFNRYAFFGSPDTWEKKDDLEYDESSIFTAKIPGAGFHQNCTRSTVAFDLTPTTDIPNTEGSIFSSSVAWHPSSPNDIMLEVLWKLNTSCSGLYNLVKCTLSAAIVEYPVQIQMNLTGTPYKGPFFSLQRTKRDYIDETLEMLPVAPDEGKNGSTYGGIATSLGRSYNSSVTTTDSLYDGGEVKIMGNFVETMALGYSYDGHSPFYCNLSLKMGLGNLAYSELLDSETVNSFVQTGYRDTHESADPADTIIGRLRQAMFLTSVYTGSQYYSSRWNISGHASHPESFYTQEVTALRSWPIIRYAIRLDLWGASLAITWTVVLAILPTFWGFWRLVRAPGLTPIDIARAFDAPVVSGVDEVLPTESLLKSWRGGRKIRRSRQLVVVAGLPPESVQDKFGRWSGTSSDLDVQFQEPMVSPRRFSSLVGR